LAVLVESEPKLRILVFYAFSSREPATASLENAMDSCLDAVSSREPVFTLLESAIGALR
jgi:hypothetical protein